MESACTARTSVAHQILLIAHTLTPVLLRTIAANLMNSSMINIALLQINAKTNVIAALKGTVLVNVIVELSKLMLLATQMKEKNAATITGVALLHYAYQDKLNAVKPVETLTSERLLIHSKINTVVPLEAINTL